MSCMGLDIGTSGCKAIVFDAAGQQIADAYREYATLMPQDGWAELDSAKVMDACLTVIAEAAAACPQNDLAQAVGISSQGEAFTAVGESGRLLTNAMVSFDTRATGFAKTWSCEFGRKALYEITGHTAHPMFTLFKLLWLKEHQPDIWNQSRHFYCFEELVHHQLGLEPAISYPLAGRTMLFNIRQHDWDESILSAIGLERTKLARSLPSGAIVGTIPKARARELGFAEKSIVVTGGHDQPCGALGAGILDSGKAMYGMGTVECICPAFESPVFSKDLFNSNLCTYDYTASGMYTTVAFSLTGGNLLRWYRDEWAADQVREARNKSVSPYQVILKDMPLEPSSLQVLPYFTPTGTPYFDTETSGAILGLRLGTKRQQVLRALLEGVAMEMKLNLEILDHSGINIRNFIAIGGGARSKELTQLKADVLNRPITTVAVTEAGCLGAAMLAWNSLTDEGLKSISRRWVRPISTLEPNPEHAAFYNEKFSKYKQLYPAIKQLS